jgi:hypothetical protein
LSIVIPIGPGDRAWVNLVDQLLPELPSGVEVVLSAAGSFPEGGPVPPSPVRWVCGAPGRAQQLNRGAAAANGSSLWFLHADTRLDAGSTALVMRCLRARPGALWYFDLRFLDDGSPLMLLNTAGVWLRSHLLRLPFGDQGLALAADRFRELGGFREDVPYGEDHLLVWSARRAGMAVRSTGHPIYTSARRYAEQGWLATTTRHLRLTWRQALPEAVRALRSGWSA